MYWCTVLLSHLCSKNRKLYRMKLYESNIYLYKNPWKCQTCTTRSIIRFSFVVIVTDISQCRFLDFYGVNSVFSFFAIMMNRIKLLLNIHWYSCSLCFWVFPTTSQMILNFSINFCGTVLRANNRIKDELHKNVSKQRHSNGNKEIQYWRVP
jgi:hypothetical protein